MASSTRSYWQWATGEQTTKIKVRMYMGVTKGVFSMVEEYDVDVVKSTTVNEIHEPIADKLLQIYNSAPDDRVGSKHNIYLWLSLNKDYLESTGTLSFSPDTFAGFPYYFVRGKWYTLDQKSPFYWNAKITDLPATIQQKGFDLFYFAPASTVKLDSVTLFYKDVYALGNSDERKDLFKSNPLSSFIVKPLNRPLPNLRTKNFKATWNNFKDRELDIPFAISATPDELLKGADVELDTPAIPGTRFRSPDNDSEAVLIDATVILNPETGGGRPTNALNTSIFNGDLELTEAVADLEPCLIDIRKFCSRMRTQLSGLHEAALLRITRTKNFQVYQHQVDRFTANAQARFAVQEMILNTQDKAMTATEQDTADKLLQTLEGQAPSSVNIAIRGAKGVAGGAVVGGVASAGIVTALNTAFTGLVTVNPWTVGLGLAVLAVAGTGGATWAISETEEGRHKNFKGSLAEAYKKSKVNSSEINRMRGSGMKAYYEVMALRNYTNIIRKQISHLVVRRPSSTIS